MSCRLTGSAADSERQSAKSQRSARRRRIAALARTDDHHSFAGWRRSGLVVALCVRGICCRRWSAFLLRSQVGLATHTGSAVVIDRQSCELDLSAHAIGKVASRASREVRVFGRVCGALRLPSSVSTRHAAPNGTDCWRIDCGVERIGVRMHPVAERHIGHSRAAAELRR